MILCLDIGNSQTFGGVYNDQDKQVFQFRFTSNKNSSSDEIGLFLISVLRANKCETSDIRHISICSVVPQNVYSIKNACLKYFKLKPFLLEAGVKTGLKIKYKNPLEVGADRIANAIAGVNKYPNQNLIIADFGTATTFCAVNKQREYLGGLIMPGLRLAMEALESKTAKLPSVEIVRPDTLLGKTTIHSIQSGLFFSNLFAIQGIIKQISQESFGLESVIVIGTGGFSRLFENDEVFDHIDSDLVLNGLLNALKYNT